MASSEFKRGKNMVVPFEEGETTGGAEKKGADREL